MNMRVLPVAALLLAVGSARILAEEPAPNAQTNRVEELEPAQTNDVLNAKWLAFRKKYEGTYQVKAKIYDVTDEGIILFNGYVAKCHIDEKRRALTLGKKDYLSERFIYVYTDPKEHKKGDTYKGLVYSCKHSQYMALSGANRKVALYSTDREKAEWIGRDRNSEWKWKW